MGHTGKAAKLGSFVPQRGGKDCVIATLATVTVSTYDEIADALGVPVDQSGKRMIAGDGIDISLASGALWEIGWMSTLLVARERSGMEDYPYSLPSSDQIKEILRGKKASVGYVDSDPKVGNHALAWDGTQAVDCSNGEIVTLDDIAVTSAVIVARVPTE